MAKCDRCQRTSHTVDRRVVHYCPSGGGIWVTFNGNGDDLELPSPSSIMPGHVDFDSDHWDHATNSQKYWAAQVC